MMMMMDAQGNFAQELPKEYFKDILVHTRAKLHPSLREVKH